MKNLPPLGREDAHPIHHLLQRRGVVDAPENLIEAMRRRSLADRRDGLLDVRRGISGTRVQCSFRKNRHACPLPGGLRHAGNDSIAIARQRRGKRHLHDSDFQAAVRRRLIRSGGSRGRHRVENRQVAWARQLAGASITCQMVAAVSGLVWAHRNAGSASLLSGGLTEGALSKRPVSRPTVVGKLPISSNRHAWFILGSNATASPPLRSRSHCRPVPAR